MSRITYPPEMLPRSEGQAEVIVMDAPTHVLTELVREHRDDGYWIGCWLPQQKAWLGEPVGPFETQDEADRALEDLSKMSVALGAVIVPGGLAN
jgi:hypothetical protein